MWVLIFYSKNNFAEKEGFEPPDLLQSTVFKTAAFDHSAISPERLTISRLRVQIYHLSTFLQKNNRVFLILKTIPFIKHSLSIKTSFFKHIKIFFLFI